MPCLSIFLLLDLLILTSYARNLSPDSQRFMDKMKELNQLQADIFGISVPEYSEEINANPYLIEGDIMLTETQLDEKIDNAKDQLWAKNHPNEINNKLPAFIPNRRWTLPISYDTDANVNQAAVLAGIMKWENETCIRFRKATLSPSDRGIRFISGSGCYSYVGDIGQRQDVSIGSGCTILGIVCHEIAHALGVQHEQCRPDRDSFVTVVAANIDPNALRNFQKETNLIDYGIGYDYRSVMHYGPTDFTKNGQKTILAIDKTYEQTIGLRDGPSFFDIKSMNMAYCSATCKNTISCQNGGYANPNNCNICKCPPGYGGTLCNVAQPGSGDCPTPNRNANTTTQTISAIGAKSCRFVITAPTNRRISFQMTEMSFSSNYVSMCYPNYIDIYFYSGATRPAARVCREKPTISTSESNRLVVEYKSTNSFSRFTMSYQII